MAGKPVRISILGDTKDFETAMDRASNSATGFGKNMDTAASKAKDAENKFDGVGEGADTLASKGAQAAGALSGLGQTVGGPFGGAMQGAGLAMQTAADSGDLLNAAIEGGGKALGKAKDLAGKFTKATGLQTAATKVAGIVQAGFNAVMDANPIALIILAIAALVAGLVIFFTKTKVGKQLVSDAFGAMKTAAKAVATFFTKDIPAAFQKVIDKAGAVKTQAVQKFKDLVTWISGLPGRVTSAAGDLFRALRDKAAAVKTWVVTKIQSLVDWFTNLPHKISSAAGDLFKSVRDKASALKDSVTGKITSIVTGFRNLPGRIYSGIKAGASTLANAGGIIINKLVSGLSGAASWAGNIASAIWGALRGFINSNLIDKLNNALDFHISILGHSVGIDLPNIPHLAHGGITNGPTLALIGDNPGGREAVIPLDRYGSLGGNVYNINVSVQAGVGNPVEIGREVSRVLKAYQRANGLVRA